MPQQQDANGYAERDGSRGKGRRRGGDDTQLHSAGSSPVGETEARSTEPLSLLPADICAFCHKAVGPREPTVEAMRKQYHADCFTCRTCHRRLAGQRYYQKDGRPTCDACYQVHVPPPAPGTTSTLGGVAGDAVPWELASHGVSVSCVPLHKRQATLEKCAKCQGLITERIVRALGKGYHPGCFSCAACGRAIGAESFAVDEQDEVYCVADFYRLGSMETGEKPPLWGGPPCPRHPTGLTSPCFAPIRKYAAVCSACEHPIIPCKDKDTYKIECLGRSFHESCYRCEVRAPKNRGVWHQACAKHGHRAHGARGCILATSLSCK